MSEKKQRRTFVAAIGMALLLFVLAFGAASCGGSKGGGGGGDGDGDKGGGTKPKDGDNDAPQSMIHEISVENYLYC